jgi:hypothetical protein
MNMRKDADDENLEEFEYECNKIFYNMAEDFEKSILSIEKTKRPYSTKLNFEGFWIYDSDDLKALKKIPMTVE